MPLKNELKQAITKHALKNATEHQGHANQGAVVGKLMALDKESRKEIESLLPEVKEIVNSIKSMSIEEQKQKLVDFEGQFEIQKTKPREGLPELEEFADGKIQCVTRYAPNPNGPFHLGNARQIFLSSYYAKHYNGKFLLRFDDTDPKVKKPMKNPEKIFVTDLE